MAAAEEFVRAATSGRHTRAEALRGEAAGDPYARLVLGEAWDVDVHAPGGPNGWAPLLYACFSTFQPVAMVEQLLARGADPNVTFANEYGDMPALYGAAGVLHNPAMTRALLEAGATPDDGESLYHATEARSPDCLKLLLDYGGTPEPIVLAHALDDERPEHVKLLLEAGAEPTELLAHAVRRGRGPECLRQLVDYGAELEHPDGETWRGDVPLRTAFQHAALRGADESARVLAELGADTHVSADDLAVAAIVRGERPAALPATLDVDQQEVVILAALRDRLTLVVSLFGPNFRGVVGGSPEGSLLQHVSWVGNPALAGELLRAGAQVPSLDWLAHGSHAHPERDYVGVAEQLVAAGAVIEPGLLEQADGPLAAWLAARLPR